MSFEDDQRAGICKAVAINRKLMGLPPQEFPEGSPAHIATLKNKIAELEKENEDLRDKIDELKNLVRNQSLALDVSEETGAREMAWIAGGLLLEQQGGRGIPICGEAIGIERDNLMQAWRERRGEK